MVISITEQDPRFELMKRSFNRRNAPSDADLVSRIELCETQQDIADALQRAVSAGLRPTVRSGGHCYEDFVVNNPGGVLLDLSVLSTPQRSEDGKAYVINPGMQLGDIYIELYKRYDLTIPAGSCYSVGAGGHISGGGYGLLSRLHGITVDYVSAVDILTVDEHGKVVQRRVDKNHDPDLFRACRGAGGGNFGIVTAFHCEKLPPAPKEVVSGGVSFDWKTMTEDRFIEIITTYGHYWETRGKDPETYGLFSLLDLSPKASERFGISLQFCNPDGTVNDLSVVNDFLDLFMKCDPSEKLPPAVSPERQGRNRNPYAGLPCINGKHNLYRSSYISAAASGGGGFGGGGGRAKYKSAYMKSNFTTENAKTIYKFLTTDVPGVDLRGFVLAIDSYGGMTNQSHLVEETSVFQRSSIMKLQYQYYWQNPSDDATRLKWLSDFYTALYTGPTVDAKYSGTPYPGKQYEGCFINYPDADMLKYSFWPDLYYGNGDLYPFLQKVKKRYDPNNIFHHSMSIRPS